MKKQQKLKLIVFLSSLLLVSSLSIKYFGNRHLAGLCIFSVVILVLAITYQILKKKNLFSGFKTTPTVYLFILYAIWSILQLCFNYSLNGLGLVILFQTGIVLSFLLQVIIDEKNRFKIIGWVFLGYAVLESVIVFLQYSNLLVNPESRFEIGGTMGNPNALSLSLLVALWFFPQHFFISKTKKERIIGIVLLIIILSVIIMLKCRTAWVALVVSSLFYFRKTLTVYYYNSTLIAKIIVPASIIALMATGGFGLYQLKPDSSIGRVLIWKNSLRLAADNLIFGVGPGNFAKAYQAKQALYFKEKPRSLDEIKVSGNTINMAYNGLLQAIIESGIIGFVLILLILYRIIRLIFRSAPPAIKLELQALFVCLFVASLFNYTLLIPTIFFQVIMLGTVIVSYDKPTGIVKHIRNVHGKNLFLPIVFLLTFQTSFFFYTQLITGKFIFLAKNEAKSTALIFAEQHKEVLSQHGESQFYHASILMQQKQFATAESILIESLNTSDNYQIWMQLGRVYLHIGKLDKAVDAFENAHYRVPALLMPRLELTKSYLRIGQEQKAYRLARATLQLGAKTDTPISRKILKNLHHLIPKQQ